MKVKGFLYVTQVARAYPISNTPVVSTLLRAEILRPVMSTLLVMKFEYRTDIESRPF